ncbi:MAG: HEAT repeat domain-containing protein [Planctomycetes bacterium]|nr:HEAT repeat domain-containing protein [Planctomycetota bacterium]
MSTDDQTQVVEWLERLSGLYCREADARDRAIREMRAAGAARLFPLLRAILSDADSCLRLQACEAVLWVDPEHGAELVLPLLTDTDANVRYHACGCLHDFGDERAVGPLARVLAHDPDPALRGIAAYALGGIGSPAAIPDLLDVMASDHEFDNLGHQPSTTAATALDAILAAERQRGYTERTAEEGAEEPDLARLREAALAAYDAWWARQR